MLDDRIDKLFSGKFVILYEFRSKIVEVTISYLRFFKYRVIFSHNIFLNLFYVHILSGKEKEI